MKVRMGSGVLAADTTATDVTWSGLGTPDAAIVVATINTSLDGQQAGIAASIGYTDFTTQFCITYSHEDGLSTRRARNGSDTSHILAVHDDNSDAFDRQATISAITDGIRLTPTASGNVKSFIVIAFFGGSWNCFQKSSTQSVAGTEVFAHGLGTKPNFGFFACSDAYNAAGNVGAEVGWGMFTDDGTIVQRAFGMDYTAGGTGTAGSYGILNTNRVCSTIDSAAQDFGFELTGNDATNVTLTVRDVATVANLVGGLVCLSSESVKLATVNSPNSAASDWNVNDTTFTPQAVIGILTGLSTADSVDPSDPGGCVTPFFGMSDQGVEISASTRLNDGSDPAEADSYIDSNEVRLLDVTGFNYLYQWANPSFTTDGFDVAAADITAASASTHLFPMLFIGQEAAGQGAAMYHHLRNMGS